MSDHGTATTAAFDAHAREYDALRRRLIPPYDAFYGNAVDALGLLGRPPKRVVDLGAGTGLLSTFVARAYPDAELVLVDGAPAMLEQAKATLPGAATHVADLNDPLPAGDYCAAVSALAIHHLADEDKRALFARVFAALRPGGIFVNAEQVLGPTPRQEEAWQTWHRETSLALGTTDEEWAAAVERMAYDRRAPAEDQTSWLREAGFVDVAIPFQDHCFAVIVALKPR